jgi:hypothetical protein
MFRDPELGARQEALGTRLSDSEVTTAAVTDPGGLEAAPSPLVGRPLPTLAGVLNAGIVATMRGGLSSLGISGFR